MPTNKLAPVTRIQTLVSQIKVIVRDMSRQSTFERREAKKPLVLRYQSWRGLNELNRRTELANKLLGLTIKLASAVTAVR